MDISEKYNKNFNHTPLNIWVQEHHSEDDLRAVFLNLDRALKYIHEHNYCIEVFYPSEIEILNNEVDHIQFKKLIELSHDPVFKDKMIREDIFNSALIQIGLYANCLNTLTPEFLKENFDSFVMFLPSTDVPYYRGVIQRNASVYFCEYAVEKRNRDLVDLEKQLGEKTSGIGDVKVKEDITNNRVNDKIYKQINGLNESAFINYLVIPTIIMALLVLLSIAFWFSSLIR